MVAGARRHPAHRLEASAHHSVASIHQVVGRGASSHWAEEAVDEDVVVSADLADLVGTFAVKFVVESGDPSLAPGNAST